MGALSDPRVGDYFADHYVAYYERIGSFTILPGSDESTPASDLLGLPGAPGRSADHAHDAVRSNRKQGGNVGSFFCNTEGQVIAAMAGPVEAEIVLAEAQWARETYQEVRSLRTIRYELSRRHRAKAYEYRNSFNGFAGLLHRIHTNLAQEPLVPVEEYSHELFTQLLAEPVDDGETSLFAVDRLIERFREEGKSFVIVVYNSSMPGDFYQEGVFWLDSQTVGIALADNEFRAMEERLGWTEHELPEPRTLNCIHFDRTGSETRSFVVSGTGPDVNQVILNGPDGEQNSNDNSSLEQAHQRQRRSR